MVCWTSANWKLAVLQLAGLTRSLTVHYSLLHSATWKSRFHTARKYTRTVRAVHRRFASGARTFFACLEIDRMMDVMSKMCPQWSLIVWSGPLARRKDCLSSQQNTCLEVRFRKAPWMTWALYATWKTKMPSWRRERPQAGENTELYRYLFTGLLAFSYPYSCSVKYLW